MTSATEAVLKLNPSVIKIMDMFPDEKAATRWFEKMIWPNGRCCGKCGSTETSEVPNAKPMPYWCRDCRSYFSVRTGTAIARSNIPLRKWAIAVYFCLNSLKSVSSTHLQKLIGVSQPAAWFMLHRIRESWKQDGGNANLAGPIETDEVYLGGKEGNKHANKKLRSGRGGVGKTPVVGVLDRATCQVRARVVQRTDAPTLHGFIKEHASPNATVYSDDFKGYNGLPFKHETVKHSAHEYVRDGGIHTNGIESAWATLKRTYHGTHHHWSVKHTQRYINECFGRFNMRHLSIMEQMAETIKGLAGKHLTYAELTH